MHPVATELVHGLRPQADVSHDWNTRRHQPGDHVCLPGGALELHPLAAGLLEDPGGRPDCRANAEVLEGERQVNDHHRPGHRPTHDLAVVDHLLERGRNRRVAARHHHRHAVANEHTINA